MKSIYDLQLHEILHLEDGTKVMRVPNGWNYIYTNSSVFVNYDEEFKIMSYQKKVTVQIASKVIANYYNLPEKFYKEKTKEGSYPKAKMMLSSILYSYARLNQQQVAKEVGYKDHSSVIHANKKVSFMKKKYRDYRAEYNSIMNEIFKNI